MRMASDLYVTFPGVTKNFMKPSISPLPAQSADDHRNQFLEVLAHELRNPLAPLRNGLEIIRRSESDPQVVSEALEVMDRQLQQLSSLIDGLVEASAIHRGHIELRRETLDLGAVIEETVEEFHERLKESGQRIAFHSCPGRLHVEGDARRLRQIVSKLIENAAKYTGRDGRIEVSLQSGDGEAEITVTDEGIGIPQEKLDEIFELFSKADHSLERGQDGLGLGLTIVRGLTELHGGTVEAFSAGVGAGSEFTVRLPLVSSQAEASIPSGKRRVLVVDDNRIVRRAWP